MRNILEFFPLARQKSATEFCGPCPSCGGDDRFIIWPQRGDTGRFMCRGCGASGDGVDYLRTFEGLSYVDACRALEIAPRDKRAFHHSASTPKPVVRPKETQAELPSKAWTTAATAVLADCQAAFLKSPEGVATICGERFIGQNTAITAGLGWNNRDRYFMREDWGLPILQGREKIIVPRGLVIATRRKSGVVGLTVRCPDSRPKDRPRYWQTAGSSQVPFVVGGIGQPVVLLESALDAVLVRQESQNTVAAVGVMGSTKDLDQATANFIRQAPIVIACPDSDEAGHKAWERWREEFPKATRISPVGAKDLTDMHKLATLQHIRGEQRAVPFVGEWLGIALEIARR